MLRTLHQHCHKKVAADEDPLCLGRGKGSCRVKSTVLTSSFLLFWLLLLQKFLLAQGEQNENVQIPWLSSLLMDWNRRRSTVDSRWRILFAVVLRSGGTDKLCSFSAAGTEILFCKGLVLADLTLLAQKKNGSAFWNNWLVFPHVISYLKIAFWPLYRCFNFSSWTRIFYFSFATLLFTSLMYF